VFGWRAWAAIAALPRFAGAAAILVFCGWFAVEQWAAHERLSDQRALDGRVFELMTRATAPGSALACLNALAGETVEAACEKALFASPEAVAAAVSYVSAQLTLLAAARDHAQRVGGGYESTLAQMRRAAESDRFGMVAHVLATRDGCTVEQCAAFALFDDRSRVSANISEQMFDAVVKRHMAAWPGEPTQPVAAVSPSGTAATAPAPIAGVRNPNLFFPSAASIPPVSIMNAEPAAQDTTGSAEVKPARKPAQARPPANANAAPSAPLPLAPQ
jgi:hypothetical protein